MKVKVNGIKLFFDVEGAKYITAGPELKQRPSIILLHGGPGADHSGFKPLFSSLTDLGQLIYLDQRGCGRSDKGDAKHWNLETWADDLFLFCQALEIEKPIVIAKSFGGFVAMAYATKYPDHPQQLILTSTSAHPSLDRVSNAFAKLGGDTAKQAAIEFFQSPSPITLQQYNDVCLPLHNCSDPDLLAKRRVDFQQDVFIAFMRDEIMHMDLRSQLHKIQCLTLVMVGDKDPLTPVEDAEEIIQALPADLAHYHCVENAGHAMFRDQPDESIDVVRDFILNEHSDSRQGHLV